MFWLCSSVTDRKIQLQRARAMRKAPTPAERVVWRIVGRDRFGLTIRRQHRIGPYIVDFLCPARKLIIEVDGGQHNGSDYDRARDAWLQGQGYEVLRFWNRDVLVNSDGVSRRIVLALGLDEPNYVLT
jgi:very-short-patch-repair endonuclease